MARTVIALVFLLLANASLATAAVSRRKATKAGLGDLSQRKAVAAVAAAPAHVPKSPTLSTGIRIGAVPKTAAGRRALFIQLSRLKGTGFAELLQAAAYEASKDYGASAELARLEAMAEAMNRPLGWVKANYHALMTTQVDRDGKPLTPGEPASDRADDEPAQASGIDLHTWQPAQGAYRH